MFDEPGANKNDEECCRSIALCVVDFSCPLAFWSSSLPESSLLASSLFDRDVVSGCCCIGWRGLPPSPWRLALAYSSLEELETTPWTGPAGSCDTADASIFGGMEHSEPPTWRMGDVHCRKSSYNSCCNNVTICDQRPASTPDISSRVKSSSMYVRLNKLPGDASC